MLGLLDGVADVDSLVRMDMLEILRHIEGNGVKHMARTVILQFEFYMLHILSDKFARSEVKDIA